MTGHTDDGNPADSATTDLAAVVPKRRTEAVIEALRAEGVYDPTRGVAAYDDDRVAVPVAEPDITVEAVDLPPRERGLEDLLAERGFAPAEIEAAPSSWAVVGSVVLADFGDVSADDTLPEERREAVGKALLELHGDADTVLARGGVSGTRRDPATEVVAGTGETETVHVEYGTQYALDLSTVTFSPRSKAERARMCEVIESGERVFDAFAGVGYFALPMARAGAEVTAAELDPEAYRLLVENARLNGVSDRLRPVLGNYRDVETTADRVVMGHHEAHERLDSALAALVAGGTVHLHEATPEPLFPDRPLERLRSAAADAGREVGRRGVGVGVGHSAGRTCSPLRCLRTGTSSASGSR